MLGDLDPSRDMREVSRDESRDLGDPPCMARF